MRELLDLCDALSQVRARLVEEELTADQRSRLRRKMRDRRAKLVEAFRAYRFRGPLAETVREMEFEAVDFEMLATLLQRRLGGVDPSIDGRELLRCAGDSSFEVLANVNRLGVDGPLRASGLIEVSVGEDEEQFGDDVLDTQFRLTDEAVQAFRDELEGCIAEDRSRRAQGYESNHEMLVDLRILHNLYKHRSERAFSLDRWDRVRPTARPLGRLDRRIESFSRAIVSRLKRTENPERLPAIRFWNEHRLDERELVVVTHLLFRELYEGNAYADAAELVRLVSRDDIELLQNRRLVLESGKLRRLDILAVEAVLDGRALTGEVFLTDWSVNYLFGASRPDPSIDTDDRLDWHLYLKNLEDTRAFFRDLDGE